MKQDVMLVSQKITNFKVKLRCPYCDMTSFSSTMYTVSMGNIHKCNTCDHEVVFKMTFIFNKHQECIYTIKVFGYEP